MAELRIATRESDLAMTQARWVADRLSEAHPTIEISLVGVSTTGDHDQRTPVATLTEVGAFVRAVQQAVLAGDADVAVHSCKDLPIDGPEGLAVVYPEREAPWDVLCGYDLETLPHGAKVGTGSPRRAAQLKILRPDVEVADIRGNVGTRLQKMEAGEYDAIVLADAGLRRLGRSADASYRFSLYQMIPAPAQAALAVETRADDPAFDLLMAIDHHQTRVAVETERALLARTGAGCRSALGVYAHVADTGIIATGFVEDEAGARKAETTGASPEETARLLQNGLGL